MPVLDEPAPVADAGADAGTDAGAAEAGASDGGDDASSNAGEAGVVPVEAGSRRRVPYDLAVVLAGDRRESAKVVLLDAEAFLRGAGIVTEGSGPAVAPGSLAPCPVIEARELARDTAGVRTDAIPWDNGIKYAPAPPAPGVEKVDDFPRGGACAASADAGADAVASPAAPDLAALGQPRPVAAVRDGTTLYVADDELPIIHVLDLSRRATVRELPPLVLTSVVDPARVVTAKQIAVSPPTREYKRYLYAIDKKDGTIAVFDVTDPRSSSRVPLTRPDPQLNPFQPPDRISFAGPVASVAFARHERLVSVAQDVPILASRSGLLCNPNRNAGTDQGPFRDDGAYYRANVTNTGLLDLGPQRLRGVFAFATLSDGKIVTIDVDDWDAPCRRPDPLDPTGQVSATALPQPAAAGADDLDPYHAPATSQSLGSDRYASPVTLEAFFPVSAPHRPRSTFYLRNDPRLGDRTPHVASTPALFIGGTPLVTIGKGSEENPIMLPTATGFADPGYLRSPVDANPDKRLNENKALQAQSPFWSLPKSPDGPPANVRFSFDEPRVQVDQDWIVTFEGALPGFDGVASFVEAGPDYKTLLLRAGQPVFCSRGVHDFRLGQSRARAVADALAQSKLPPVPKLERRIADYVQVTDAVLPPEDPYWREPNDCWQGLKRDGDRLVELSDPGERQALCAQTYGADIDGTTERDFPILEAYDDRMVIGRFGYEDPASRTTRSREVVDAHESNAPFLKTMRCCFHNQVRFRVRAGGQWVALGTGVGHLHHVRRDPSGACTESCEPRDALLNARAVTLPRPVDPAAVAPGRNSPLALRNPMFSFLMWGGLGPAGLAIPGRDAQWKFASRGQFVPQTINLAGSTSSVSPQSMRYIDVLRQLAVVDGASQGLVLIDLDTVNLARSPYF
jgi:hypothetical protein